MSTILFPSPIFGPVQSRRLGVSLGVNLLPAHGKLCNFDCIYCECGFNIDGKTKEKLPSREEVREALEQQLQKMKDENLPPDVITFAGNGEPTIHPMFPQIIDDTIELRNTYAPLSKISVLSNAVYAGRPKIKEALLKVDNSILKLDTVNPGYISLVDRPSGRYEVDKIVENLRGYNGNVIIQTMFMSGEYQGHSVSNVSDDYVLPWLEAVKQIAPREVMIYTIDRETPSNTLRKASPKDLDRIVGMIEAQGIKASASY